MKKIPTLFKREFDEHNHATIYPIVTEGFEWVLKGEGTPTIKWDGACCCLIDGELYKRYDAKHGKPIPQGAIPCQDEADAITGHFPCWLKCNRDNPEDKWFWFAYDKFMKSDDPILKTNVWKNWTYEAVGKHFNGNPYEFDEDELVPHGMDLAFIHDRSFEGIRDWLEEHNEEGLVFWKDGKPQCKIKRKDFGFRWNKK